MGTYIHPSTSNVSLTEQCAGVALGTWERLAALEAKYPNLNSHKREHAHEYEEYHASLDQDMAALDSFRLFGWDILSPAAHVLIESWGLDPALGSISDRSKMYKLLLAQGVAKPGTLAGRLDSIYWG